MRNLQQAKTGHSSANTAAAKNFLSLTFFYNQHMEHAAAAWTLSI